MNKVRIDLDILLPDVPDERDECIARIIRLLQNQRGIEKVHVIPEGESSKAQLCFHYDSADISIEGVQNIAKRAGARITDRFHHLLVEVEGIRHQRQTRLIENSLKRKKGILSVSVSGGGMILLEFDTQLISEKAIRTAIKKEGLGIIDEKKKVEDSARKEKDHHHDHPDGHKHEHEEGSDHNHSHGGIFGKNTELIFSIICGILLGIGFGLSFIESVPLAVSIGFYIGAYFFGGFYTAKEAIETIANGGFEIDFLMLVAAIGAGLLGDWAEGALLLFLFSLGHALEHFAMAKAQKSIASLTELAPKTALLKQGDGTEEIAITDLKMGDVVVVKPNTKIAADGFVVKGNSSVNQAPITGESIPTDKVAIENQDIDINEAGKLDAKYRVFAGTINGNASLEIKVIKEAKDSTVSRLVKMVSEAQTQKSPTQLLTDKVEKYFVPCVLILVVLLCLAFLVIDEPFSASFYRAMSVLVAASPCALAIATPSAVLSGVARAARAGVLIKGGKPLEESGTLTAIAFDKTGTLTEGKPKLTQIITLSGMTEQELLKIVVAVEALSDHPIAKAIVRGGKEKLDTDQVAQASNMEAVLGKGIKATLNGEIIFMGNLALFEKLDENKPSEEIINQVRKLENEGNTAMLTRKGKEYIGLVAVMDTPRAEAKVSLEALKKAGIKRMIMLTGDNQQVAEAVAKETGLTEAWGGLLPEQKVEAIRKLQTEEKHVAMVGDGVNDAPAMANSTVGIAMGAAGSDVALETADIALMGDKLELLPFALGLSRKAKGIIRQNLVISLGMVVLLIPLTISGIASIGPAVIAHEGSTLVVVFNALRLLTYKR